MAVGITNQRETTLLWDRRSGRPLHSAIVWLDTRTAPICERMAAELDGGAVSLACSRLLHDAWDALRLLQRACA